MAQDIRLALRLLNQHKGFTLAALTTLALGIGANTAIFSVVYGVLLRPLPFAEPDRIVRLSEARPGGTPVFAGQPFTNVTYHAWQPGARTIGAIASFDAGTFTVGFDEPARVRGAWAGTGLFDVLRVAPQLGRFFVAEDGAEGMPDAVVLSDGLWSERFGRSPEALGRTLPINGSPHVIVGVAPRGLHFPDRDTRLWVASGPMPPPARGRIQVASGALARLAPGATPAAAAAEGTAVARSIEWPTSADFFLGQGGPHEVRVTTLADDLTGRIRPALLVLLIGVACLLLIACANVANLFLSRGVSRERELAVRVALGAGRRQLIRQLLSESLVIAAAGGAIGMALASALVRALPAAAPEEFPRLDAVHMDWRAWAFATAVSLAAGLLSGLVPALRGARPDLLPALRDGVGASSARRTARLRSLLLASEAALAVMLLVAGMLLGRSFVKLLNVDPGFDRDHVLATRIHLPRTADSDPFLNDLLTRLRARPGVTAAGAGNMMPLGESSAAHTFTPKIPGREPVTVRGRAYWVTPGYAEAVGLRLRAGRVFDASDLSSPLQSMLVNEEFVRTALQGVAPIDLQVPSMMTGGATAQIVGVVGNVLKEGLATTPQPEIYVPAPAHKYSIRGEINLVVRTAGDPLAHAASLRALVRELRPDAAMDQVTTLADKVSASVAQPRFATMVLASFAITAVLLAAIGLYGVLAYVVARRQRELGVRAALGATRTTLMTMVLRDGMTVTLVGLVAGLAGAAALTRLMQSLLFGVEPLDPVSFAVAALLLTAVALAACALPARRAASIDPAIALRME